MEIATSAAAHAAQIPSRSPVLIFCSMPEPSAGRTLSVELELDQPIRRLRKNSEIGQLAPHHRDLIAIVIARADVAVLVDFVGKVFASGDGESLAGKKIRSACE